MFDVTDTYKTLIKQPTRYVGISGAVKLRSGTVVQFTDKNIVSGSLSITDRLNRRGDFRPGGVYSSGLSIGFTGLFARTNDLDGAVIRLNYHIYPNAEMKASEAQTVPLGRFYVDGSTIKRTRSTVRLKADDGLMLFDVPATERSGTLYELVTGACAAAGVGFAMSQEQFEALPNATLSAAINTARIQNERDLLMYVGMITGSFARITRSALALEFVPLTCEKDDSTHMIIPVREIAGNIRFSTDFSDDTTRIAKIFMRRNGAALYSSYNVTAAGSEKLATLELDENPLLSALTDDEVKTALNALLAQIYLCLNRVFDAEFTGDPALEVGDYVRLRGGEIDTDRGYATGMITSQTWTYHGTHQIRCSMPSSLVYSGDAETAAVMALADNEETATTTTAERVQPKSQIEKRLDAIEAGMNGSGNSASALTSYEYLTDLSVKFNGVTYTVEKDSGTGLINKISDSSGNSFEPMINSGIADIALHNAVFWAVAMCRGLSTPKFIMDGIMGMFTTDTRDIGNSLWRNAVPGYNNMTLSGGSENGDAVHFEKTHYGSFTCAEPNTVYAVVKTETSTNSSNCVITKKLSSLGSSSKYGFNLLQGQGGGYLYFSGAGLDIAQRNIGCDEYHVYCYTRSEKDVYYYIDGVLIGSVSGCNIGLYSGIMYLNNEYFGSTRLDNPTVCDFLMCAFGTTYHNEATVRKNMAYLANKYLASVH